MYALVLAAALLFGHKAHAHGHPRHVYVEPPVIFTFDEPGWHFSDPRTEPPELDTAAIVDASGAPSPTKILRMVGNGESTAPTPTSGIYASLEVPAVIPGAHYQLAVWVNGDNADAGTPVRFAFQNREQRLHPPDVPFSRADGTDFAVFKADVGPGWQRVVLGTVSTADFVLPLQVARIGIQLANGGAAEGVGAPPSSGPLLGTWLVDNVELVSSEEDEMSKRREVREALVARVKTVTAANGYGLTLDANAVVKGATSIQGPGLWPHVAITHGDFVTVVHTLGGRMKTVLTCGLGIACKLNGTTDPDDQCDDAYSEIASAILIGPGEADVNGSNKAPWLGLSYIEDIQITEGETPDLAPEVARDTAALNLTVAVTYYHHRRQP